MLMGRGACGFNGEEAWLERGMDACRGEWGTCCGEEEGSAIFLVGLGEE